MSVFRGKCKRLLSSSSFKTLKNIFAFTPFSLFNWLDPLICTGMEKALISARQLSKRLQLTVETWWQNINQHKTNECFLYFIDVQLCIKKNMWLIYNKACFQCSVTILISLYYTIMLYITWVPCPAAKYIGTRSNVMW